MSTDTVRLARSEATDGISFALRPEQPEQENDVLVVDYYGRAENRPLIRWLSSGKLQVTVANISGIGLQKTSYREVEIVVNYDADDPVARNKWQKDHGLTVK